MNSRTTYTAWKVSKYGIYSGPYLNIFDTAIRLKILENKEMLRKLQNWVQIKPGAFSLPQIKNWQ